MAELEIIGPSELSGVRICRLACLEKGIPYQHRDTKPSLRRKSESAFNTLPALRHGKVKLFGVRGITCYLDGRFNGRKLVPADPIRAAEVEQWISIILRELNGLLDPATSEAASKDACVRDCLGAIDASLDHRFWLVGRSFTLADMTLMPVVENLQQHLSEARMRERYPAVQAWYAKHSGRRTWKILASQCAQGISKSHRG